MDGAIDPDAAGAVVEAPSVDVVRGAFEPKGEGFFAGLPRLPNEKAAFGVSAAAALVEAGVAVDAGVPSENAGVELGVEVEAGGLSEKEGAEVVFAGSAGFAPPRENVGMLLGATYRDQITQS